MNAEVLKYCCFMLLGVFISSCAQVMLKKSAMKKYDSKIREYLNPLVIFGYMIFFGATLLSVLAYKVVPLSFGPIIEATSFIYVTVFGALFFGEKVNAKKIVALVLIVCGIVLFSFSTV